MEAAKMLLTYISDHLVDISFFDNTTIIYYLDNGRKYSVTIEKEEDINESV